MMIMSNTTYDRLKYVAQIVLPALGTLYAALAVIWGFPYGEQIVGTISAVDVFLGALLKYSSDKYVDGYSDGQLVVDTTDPFKDVYSIVIDNYPEKLAEKDTVVLKVARHMATEGDNVE